MNPSEDIVNAENARINEKYQSLQNLQFFLLSQKKCWSKNLVCLGKEMT